MSRRLSGLRNASCRRRITLAVMEEDALASSASTTRKPFTKGIWDPSKGIVFGPKIPVQATLPGTSASFSTTGNQNAELHKATVRFTKSGVIEESSSVSTKPESVTRRSSAIDKRRDSFASARLSLSPKSNDDGLSGSSLSANPSYEYKKRKEQGNFSRWPGQATSKTSSKSYEVQSLPKPSNEDGIPDWAGILGISNETERAVTRSGSRNVSDDDPAGDAIDRVSSVISDEISDSLSHDSDIESELIYHTLSQDQADEAEEESQEFFDADEEFEDIPVEEEDPKVIDFKNAKGYPLVLTEEKDPYVELEHQMTEADLASAMKSGNSWTFQSYLNKESLPPTLHYVSDLEEMERVSKLFLGSPVLGFDMEWKPNSYMRVPKNSLDIRKASSLVQIANADRIALFHLANFPAEVAMDQFVSPTFKSIIEDPKIIKTGVAIKGDLNRLAIMVGVSPAGAVDLNDFRNLIEATKGDGGRSNTYFRKGLALLTEEYLKLPLEKGAVRTSDWSQALEHNQRLYAANDAYAGFRIFDELDRMRRSIDPRPALPKTVSVDSAKARASRQKRVDMKEIEDKLQDLGLGVPKKTVIRVPKDANPELKRAYEWIQDYAKTVPDEQLTAAVADLRCYSLWQHQSHDIEDVAKYCRDPPLAPGYVAVKVLEAVKLQNLPYDVNRLRTVLALIPQDRSWRYRSLARGSNGKSAGFKPASTFQ